MHTNRRTALKLLGGTGLIAAALPVLPLSAIAQDDVVVPNTLENTKRGTIHSMHPEVRSFTIVWEDLGRVKMKAADLVTNYGSLKPGQIVDVHWYDYMDFLIAKKSPESSARGKALMRPRARGSKAFRAPSSGFGCGRWTACATKVDQAANTVFLINASGGEPDKPSPDSGEVIQMPPIVTANGKAALKTIKPGDQLVTVFSQQTAISVTIIR